MEKLTTLLKKAQDLNINKKYDEVIELLPIEILEKYNHADLYAEKGAALGFRERYEECEIMAQKSIEIDINCAKGYNSLGIISDILHKDNKKAENYYLKAIEIAPKYMSPYNGIGILYRNEKKYKEAEEYYLKAIEIDYKYTSAYNGLGNVYYDLKIYEKAEEYYLKAIRIDHQKPYPYNGLGCVYLDLKNYEESERYFLKAIELDSKYLSSLYNLGEMV